MPFGPLYGIHSAVNAPFPSQRLTVAEALASYTREAAYAIHEETSRGILEEGKLADIVVLDKSPFGHEASIDRIKVRLTVIGGRVAYRR
jgi:predicted amidohydrolase YtcJ